jgi:rubredoxin
MTKWKCTVCGWIYDPAIGVKADGIEPGIDFSDLPDNFRCPQCGAIKKWFKPLE